MAEQKARAETALMTERQQVFVQVRPRLRACTPLLVTRCCDDVLLAHACIWTFLSPLCAHQELTERACRGLGPAPLTTAELAQVYVGMRMAPLAKPDLIQVQRQQHQASASAEAVSAARMASQELVHQVSECVRLRFSQRCAHSLFAVVQP